MKRHGTPGWLLTNPSAETIHSTTLNSASGITEKQYLLLRVLWIAAPGQQFNSDRFGLGPWKQQADKLLATYRSWDSYHRTFAGSTILEGTFALAKRYQAQAAASREEMFRSQVTFTPVAQRTRHKMSSLEQRMRQVQLETPTKSTGRPPTTPGTEDVDDTDEEETPFRSPGPQEIMDLMYPPTKDEQIVNTALVDFLNALTMHFTTANDWSLHRKSFKAKFAHASFEARTDERKRNPICMQEAAQMAAWIKTDPDLSGTLNLPGR
ncbi:hypothetical protein BO71DRAFT_423098 [Aspergillus ellipticus CBS 707.79]|uniref:Uncharacterized protein n=1 Tax=Aspergillus ellipticus CBS 707.79 TaxID=1448320 RepID=A0A319CVI6_9EURO|nr:hypothetical protein BO71DRAFT_423098 [Aspergillus ellipticus CBS 707.79]